MFDGFLAFSGTEIVNSARTRTYLQNFLPSLAPSTCCECDDLAAALGDDEYASPMQDDAPWFNEYRTESQEFYGLFPLALEGFEDSTLTTPVVEVTGDGGTFGRPRRTTNTLRLRGLAMAGSEKAMDFGLSWLRDALSGSPCAAGDCSGDTLCFLTDCPQACDWSDAPSVVVDEPYSSLTSAQVSALLPNWSPSATLVTSLGAPAMRWSGPVHAERTLTGLVPGTAYRASLSLFSASTVTISVPGAIGGLRVDPVPSAGVLPDPADGGVGVFVFTPSASEQRLVFSGDSDITLASIRVERTSSSLLAMITQPDTHPDEAFAWTQDWAAAGSNFVGPYSGAIWSFRTITGTTAVAAGALGVVRRITGLVPGRQYTITAAVQAQVFSGPGVALGVTMSVVGQPGSVSGATSTISGSAKGGWLSLTFTATAASHTVRVAQRDSLTLTTTEVHVGADYLRVQETAPEVVDPTSDQGLWRYYRNVSVQSGLTIVNTFPQRSGVLREVEVVFVAGNPQPVGPEILVSSSLGPGTSVVPEVACSNGAAVRHNLAQNPSFEVNASNSFTLSSGTLVTLARVADATAPVGANTLRLTGQASVTGLAKVLSYLKPVTQGLTNAFSFQWTSSMSGVVLTVQAESYRADATLISTMLVAQPTLRQVLAWESLGFVHTPPAGATSVIYKVSISAPWTVGAYVGIDAVLDERSQVVRPYFDGNFPDATWDGPVGSSTSTYTKSSTAVVVDPDCPPPPPAPRPPVIDDSCVSSATTWVRHAIDVPAQFTSLSPRVLPVAALTTGSSAARGVRVRVYPNPFHVDVANLDPCSYCGEFLLSYLPANSTLTVDASTRTVMAGTAGRTTSAMNLLYGSDGGPMTWPEMDCSIPYIITVDLDAAVSPLINLALSVVPVY